MQTREMKLLFFEVESDIQKGNMIFPPTPILQNAFSENVI